MTLYRRARKYAESVFLQPHFLFDVPASITTGGFPVTKTIDLTLPLAIGSDGITLIKRFEGCARLRPDGRYAAYPDPGTGGAPWTIGWGATGPDIGPDTVWSKSQCDARLVADLARYAADVRAALDGAPTTRNQFDALVSFHYNTGAIRRATLTRRHREGDHAAAEREFRRWVRAGGKVLTGLVRRRRAEARLYAGIGQ